MRSPATLLPQYLVCGCDTASKVDGLGEAGEHETLEIVRRALEGPEVAPDQHGGQRGPLPEVVMVGLGDRRAEALLELGLHGKQFLALAFERPVVWEMQVDLDESQVAQDDEAGSSVRST
jgi:hypothetical protein